MFVGRYNCLNRFGNYLIFHDNQNDLPDLQIKYEPWLVAQPYGSRIYNVCANGIVKKLNFVHALSGAVSAFMI